MEVFLLLYFLCLNALIALQYTSATLLVHISAEHCNSHKAIENAL